MHKQGLVEIDRMKNQFIRPEELKIVIQITKSRVGTIPIKL